MRALAAELIAAKMPAFLNDGDHVRRGPVQSDDSVLKARCHYGAPAAAFSEFAQASAAAWRASARARSFRRSIAASERGGALGAVPIVGQCANCGWGFVLLTTEVSSGGARQGGNGTVSPVAVCLQDRQFPHRFHCSRPLREAGLFRRMSSIAFCSVSSASCRVPRM